MSENKYLVLEGNSSGYYLLPKQNARAKKGIKEFLSQKTFIDQIETFFKSCGDNL